MRKLYPGLSWSDIAVLARTRESLAPIRAMCENRDIPVRWGVDPERCPALQRVREIARFLDFLKACRVTFFRASQLQDLLRQMAEDRKDNPWDALLEELLSAWEAETADAELPASQTIEWIYESLAERRREQRIGQGVLLSTIHGAKGSEHRHVFVLDGDWKTQPSEKSREEERRILYVAMTRAIDTLCIFHRPHAPNPYLSFPQGDFLAWRRVDPKEALPPEISRLRYELLGMRDLDLGFAGRKRPDNPVHEHLAGLEPGAPLTPQSDGASISLYDPSGNRVAKLSRTASEKWLPKLSTIRQARVAGMLQRTVKDEAEAFRPQCKCEQWEVPWVEFVHLPD
jgi:ATP-dependent DNA helicase RecQ